MNLKDKKILLGISGGIAAYKVPLLLRLLVRQGAIVKIIQTNSSKAFVGAVALSTLSKNKVYCKHYDTPSGDWVDHVKLAIWADLMLIAPCTSNTIAKMANGICDNLLLAVYLSAKCPVLVAPSMDLDMAIQPSLLRNINTVKRDGIHVLDFGYGELASGLVGKGRMKEPEEIFEKIEQILSRKKDFQGLTCMVNAGPTHEALDPVRFIGNRSTGKMGVAIANELASRGANVFLILGPTATPHSIDSAIDVQNITTARELSDACNSIFPKCNLAILTAAVADYAPKVKSDIKIKKSSNTMTIELVKTIDVLASLGKVKTENQFLVGFALETNNEIVNAKAKLQKKNLDLVVLNSLQDKGAGFGHDTNKVTLIGKNEVSIELPLKTKKEVAKDLCDHIINKINK